MVKSSTGVASTGSRNNRPEVLSRETIGFSFVVNLVCEQSRFGVLQGTNGSNGKLQEDHDTEKVVVMGDFISSVAEVGWKVLNEQAMLEYA